MEVRPLSQLECIRLIDANRVGYLACARDNRPYIVPIYYAHSDNHLYAFSLPGRKTEWMRANPYVSLFVQEQGSGCLWRSVMIDGRFEEIPDSPDMKIARDQAWSLLSKHSDWWEPGSLKPDSLPLSDQSPHIFFRIHIDDVSGREISG